MTILALTSWKTYRGCESFANLVSDRANERVKMGAGGLELLTSRT